MNVERIRELADVIAKQVHAPVDAPYGFNMENWSHDCGTPACICGWANHLINLEQAEDKPLGSERRAAEWLGIDRISAEWLFEPEQPDDEAIEAVRTEWWGDITPAHAAAVLRHLADTGSVDWTVGASEALS